MDFFNWKDIFVVLTAIFGAIWSSKKMPGINSSSMVLNFAKEIMTTVSIVNFCTIIYSENINRNIVIKLLNEGIPFYAYALAVSLGVVLVVNAIFQTILVKKQNDTRFLWFFVPFISIINLGILVHLLYIS
jgi:hypothetical protein